MKKRFSDQLHSENGELSGDIPSGYIGGQKIPACLTTDMPGEKTPPAPACELNDSAAVLQELCASYGNIFEGIKRMQRFLMAEYFTHGHKLPIHAVISHKVKKDSVIQMKLCV